MYLEYVLPTGVCSAFRVMAIFKGDAVKTNAALAIALPLVIHLAGRFRVWGGPHFFPDDSGRLHPSLSWRGCVTKIAPSLAAGQAGIWLQRLDRVRR